MHNKKARLFRFGLSVDSLFAELLVVFGSLVNSQPYAYLIGIRIGDNICFDCCRVHVLSKCLCAAKWQYSEHIVSVFSGVVNRKNLASAFHA
jgi:hypothetical protein